MNERHDLTAQIRSWIGKAENDFRNAEYVMTMEDDCPFDTVCFHCQQGAEKYLKALLIHHEIEFPRTHDLVPLLNFLCQKVDIPLEVEQGQPLNRYSIEARYPDDWYPIDRQEATHGMKLARNVRDTVRRLMPKEVLEG